MLSKIRTLVAQENAATKLLDLLLQNLDMDNRGLLIFDAGKSLQGINAIAAKVLGLPGNILHTPVDLEATGYALGGLSEFMLRLNAQSYQVMGREHKIKLGSGEEWSFFIFTSQNITAPALHKPASALEAIIGNSEPIRKLKAQVRKIAHSNSTVLISGESGTGKDMIARAIHNQGDRKDGPFIAINCGAIPDNLLESELFGYIGGAFTGAAVRGRVGKFELAHGGVIFLDEITTMPLTVQATLLRVLQDRRVIRLGSNTPVNVDIRVMAATNESLPKLIAENLFREDLYYRLNVIPIELPPLRARRGDIDLLLDFFLEKYQALFKKPKPRLAPEVLAILHNYLWPGNVRELENVVEYMVNMMPSSGVLGLMQLPNRFLQNFQPAPVAPAQLPHFAQSQIDQNQVGQNEGGQAKAELAQASYNREPHRKLHPELSSELHQKSHSAALSSPRSNSYNLTQIEQQTITAALEFFGYSTAGKRAAAKALGLSLGTLYRKLKEGEKIKEETE